MFTPLRVDFSDAGVPDSFLNS
uniref:Uncharacterized protein n=1 Tax=Romanomermis culicivorax TaxID=13658 RepID=A0A915ILG8_ROMCU